MSQRSNETRDGIFVGEDANDVGAPLRVTRGAISLSSSSHFPLMPYLNTVNPVALPPGRARLSTKPAPTGSIICVNTTGTAPGGRYIPISGRIGV
jgi:hypothetical protein